MFRVDHEKAAMSEVRAKFATAEGTFHEELVTGTLSWTGHVSDDVSPGHKRVTRFDQNLAVDR